MQLVGVGVAYATASEWRLRPSAGSAWRLLGACLAGALFGVVGVQGLFLRTKAGIDNFLLWLPIAALAVTFFSVANAVYSQPSGAGDTRDIRALFGGLLGLWGQLITVWAACQCTTQSALHPSARAGGRADSRCAVAGQHQVLVSPSPKPAQSSVHV